MIPAEPEVTPEHVRRQLVGQAKAATKMFSSERKAAIQEANEHVPAATHALRTLIAKQHAARQAEADAWWSQVLAGDADTVLGLLADAFEDNEAPAAAVDLTGGVASLVVLVPPPSVLPEKKPGVTEAGNVSIRKLTKRDACDVYKSLVCGHVIVTVKEAFAVAPAIQAARVVAVRASDPDAYGDRHPQVLVAGLFERARFDRVQWKNVEATTIFNDCAVEKRFVQKGSTKELQPIDMTKEPDLRAVLGAVDMSELLAGR